MHHMQSTYQDNMSDIMTSFHFMNQIQHSFQLDHHHQQQDFTTTVPLSTNFDSMLTPPTTVVSTPIYEPMVMFYPDLPMVLDPNMSNTKMHINDDEFSIMQNSYHISPAFTVVPPTYNGAIMFDEQQQEQQLQKNLVKDVFFSPAMIGSQKSHRLSLQSDDCHSLVSDTTSSLSVCSPSYQYSEAASVAEIEEDSDQVTDNGDGTTENVYSNGEDDQLLFFYGLDLATATTEEEKVVDTKSGAAAAGLGTTTTTTTSVMKNTTLQQTSANNRSLKQKMMLTGTKNTCLNERSSSPTATKKKNKKTCNNDIAKILTTKKKSTRKSVSNKTSNENKYCSDATSASCSSSWGYKRSDNKKVTDNSKAAASAPSVDNEFASTSSMTLLTNNKPRYIMSPSIYQKLSKQNIDWCRYCGTTEGVNWRPGPWGKRTLCNKHGCDYKGYGFACKLPRLDLTAFTSETIDKRSRPVLQLFCSHCQRQESWKENQLVLCDGCPKAYHQKCHHNDELTDAFLKSDVPWYCSDECQENLKRKRVVVELPRKRLPLMRTPKNATLPANSETSSTTRLPRSSLREI